MSKSKNLNAKSNISKNSLEHYHDWQIMTHENISLNSPIIIEGMPGIGNVGKISMDILIEETKAKLFMSFFSHNMPNSVFVNEENLIDLPKIELYYKKIGSQDFLFLTGDVQPTTEQSSYTFTQAIINIFKKHNAKHIVTLGGIGLSNIPETPKIYITGNNKQFLEEITKSILKKKLVVETKIYGMVGPIIGISGLMLGIAKKDNINAYSLLGETLGHPMYVGLKASKEILTILNKNYSLNLTFEKLDKEIKEIDSKGSKDSSKYSKHTDVNYIG